MTRQLQVISSILTNWKDAAGAYTDAMNSAGVAMEANSTYMDSINGKIGQFKASFQELSTTLINSDLVAGVVDIGNVLVEFLTTVIDKIGGIGTAGIAGFIASFANVRKSVGRPENDGFH